MKRMMAFFLAVMIFLGCMPQILLTEVFAAPVPEGFILRWNQELAMTDTLTTEARSTLAADEVFLEWDFQRIGGSTYDNLGFELKYHLEDGKTVLLEVQRLGTYAVVSYSYYTSRGGVNIMGANPPPTIFKVTDNAYRPAAELVAAQNYKVILDDDPRYDPTKLQFEIIRDTGFAFKIDNKIIKFKWVPGSSSSGDRFYFQTTGAAPMGRIYDFNLTCLLSGADNFTKTLDISTGLGDSSIRSIPFDKGQPNFITDDLSEEGSFNGRTIYSNTGYKVDKTATATVPAPEPVNKPGLYLVVNYPTEWVWDENSTSTEPTGKFAIPSAVDGEKVNVNIHLESFQVVVEDIFRPSSADSSLKAARTDIGEKNITAKRIVDAYGNPKLLITLFDLPSGLVYDTARTWLVKEINAAQRVNKEYSQRLVYLSWNKIYTFPNFKVISLGPIDFSLEVQPFVNAKNTARGGYYRVYSSSDPYSFRKLADVSNTQGATILIPLSLNALSGGTQWLSFDFSPTPITDQSENVLSSQLYGYTPVISQIDLGVPQNLSVVPGSVRVIKDENNNDYLTFKAEWDIGRKDVVSSLITNSGVTTLEYWFKRGYTQGAYDIKTDSFAKVIIDVDLVDPTDLNSSIACVVGYEKKKHDGSYLENMAEVLQGTDNSGVRERYDELQGVTVLRAYATFKLSTFDKDGDTPNQYDFFNYPNTYFITTSGEYYKPLAEPPVTHSTSESLTASLTANRPENAEVSIPKNIIAVLNTNDPLGAVDLSWNPLNYTDYEDYIKYMLNPKGLTLAGEESVSYNVYITQKLESIEQLLKVSGNTLKIQNPGNDANLTSVNQMLRQYTVNGGSAINVETGILDDGSGTVRNWLRGGNNGDSIVRVANLKQTDIKSSLKLMALFEGLDKNQVYYFCVETVFTPVNYYHDEVSGDFVSDNVLLYDEQRISRLSSIVSQTTRNDVENPADREIEPPAPTGVDKEDVTLNSATVFWDRVQDLPVEEAEKYGYEVIRLTGLQMDADMIHNKVNFGDVWASLSALSTSNRSAAWRVKGLETTAYMYNGTEFTDRTSEGLYDYSLTSLRHNLFDKSALPNTMYFYYVRTIKLDADGNPIAWSSWVAVSVTTSTVEGPTNLVELRDAQRDKKTEVVINFDSRVNLNTPGASDVFSFEYSIKIDGQDWQSPVVMSSSALTIVPPAGNGEYTNYTYKITGLKPGTSYSIRVRMVDKTVNDASPYSNIITTRTQGDQDDYDNEKDTEKWLEELRKQLQELLKYPYWIAADSSSTFEAIYRADMFNAIMAQSPGGNITLGTGSGMNQSYYIPSQVLQMAIDANATFTITDGDVTVSIPASAFVTNATDGLISIGERIKDRSIKDYFVKISVVQTGMSEYIDGNQPMSNRINISFHAVGNILENKVFDADIETILYQLIEDRIASSSLADTIKNMVINKTDPVELVRYINEVVESVQSTFVSRVYRKLNASYKYEYEITRIERPYLTLVRVADGDSVHAYSRISSNTWTMLETITYGDKRGFSTTVPGTFAFAGVKITIPGIENVQNGGSITAIVAKYGLDDFFGKGSSFNLYVNCTTADIVGAVARMAGAPKGSDYFKYLNDKGFGVSSRTGQSHIAQQEAVYLTMMLYQVRTGTNISTIRITNFTATAGMKIDDKYKQSVRVAHQMGLINSGFDPKGQLSVQAYLEMLAGLSAKIKL